MSKVYLITGASSGFGRALAEAVLTRGDKAVLAARRLAGIEELAAQYKDNAIALKLDVTNESERRQAVKSAIEKFGGCGCVGKHRRTRKFGSIGRILFGANSQAV